MIQSQLIINLEVRLDSRDGDFYTGLAFLPVEETEQVIKDHRLTVKYDPAGVKVYAPIVKNEKGENELLIPIKAKKKLRWLLKPHTKGFFDLVTLPFKEGLYFMSNWAGDPVRFNKFLKRSVYGEMERMVYKNHDGFCFGFIGRNYSSIHHVNEGKNEIELIPPPVQRIRKEDFSVETVFPDLFESKDPIAKITRYPKKHKNRYIDHTDDNVIEVTSKADTSIRIDYPVGVKGYNYAFAVLDLYFIDKLMGLSLDEEENFSMPTNYYYLILKRQKDIKK
jgi:hypothetical protein